MGIGKTNPSSTLDVTGGIAAAGGSNNGVYAVTTGSSPTAGVYGYTAGTTGNGVRGVNNGGSGAGVIGENTGSGTAVYGFQNSSGNVFAGNHTGGSGNLINLQSSSSDMFTVDRNGNVTAVGAITAGCPTGTVSAGDFCIDSSSRGFANWRAAVNTCRGAGMHLCSAAELQAGCQAGGIGFAVAPTMYYVSDISAQSGRAASYSNTSSGCSADPVIGDTLFSTTMIYYCCRGK